MYQKDKFKTLTLGITILCLNVFIYNKFTLLHDTTRSPDFGMYIKYIEYFFGASETTSLDNGSMYFYLLSNLLTQYEGFFSGRNHFNIINNSIHLLNLFLTLISLFGFYRYFSRKNYTNKSILFGLILLSIFPPLLQLRLTMKPEILVVALLPYLLVSLENYFSKSGKYDIYFSAVLFVIIGSLRGSALVFISIFLLYTYWEDLKKVPIKNFLINLLIVLLIAMPLMLEDYNINGNTLFSNSEVRSQIGGENYNNKASFKNIFNINPINLVVRPYLDNHADSFIGITLLDTFNDYFHLYWNHDQSLLNRGQILKNINSNNSYLQKIINNFEYYFALLLSLCFFTLLIRTFLKNKELKFLVSPFAGMILLIINSFGVPYNNFDPLKADTYKSFYYSFFLCIAFLQLILHLMNREFKVRKGYMLISSTIYATAIIICLGFPKFYTPNMEVTMTTQNLYSPLCSINISLDNKLKDDDCFFVNDNFCGWSDNYQPIKLLEDGTKEYLVDDNFGQANLIKNGESRIVYGFAECDDFKSQGYEFYISKKNLKYSFTLNIYIIAALVVLLSQELRFLRFSKDS